MAAKKTTKPKRASGPTQPEAERRNPQFKLRLPPDVVEEIRAQSRHLGVTVSELVTRAWCTYVDA